MTAQRILTLLAPIGIAAALAGVSAQDTEARLDLEHRRVAPDLSPYEAPVEPPDPPRDEPALAAPAAPIDLRDAQALALMGSPELVAFSWEERAAEARARELAALPMIRF